MSIFNASVTSCLAFRRVAALTMFLVLTIAGLLLASLPSAAQASNSIAQDFPSSTGRGAIVTGALVSLKANSNSVELAATDSANRLVGVADARPLLVITGNGANQTQVVINGTTAALVSDINGSIHAGDKITASPIAGVGMVATADARVVGAAQTDFNSSGSQTRTVADTSGHQHTVHIGLVSLQIGLANYQAPGSNFLPPFVQSLANDIAGKQVSLIRVVFATVLLLFSFVSLAILIASSVRSAMISLGRNPLAAADIRRSLFQVGGVVVTVLGGTLLACYLILIL